MARGRSGPYVNVKWLAKVMSGDDACRWKLWFMSHNFFEKVPSDFDLTKWTLEHNMLLEQQLQRLRTGGYAVYLEGQNDFTVRGQSGAKLVGKADIVAIRDADAVVIDCKTGRDRNADRLQVLLYMWALPHNVAHCRGLQLRGEVQYKEHAVAIPHSALDQTFRDSLKMLMAVATSDREPQKVPSYSDCQMCDLTIADCPERVEERPPAGETDEF